MSERLNDEMFEFQEEPRDYVAFDGALCPRCGAEEFPCACDRARERDTEGWVKRRLLLRALPPTSQVGRGLFCSDYRADEFVYVSVRDGEAALRAEDDIELLHVMSHGIVFNSPGGRHSFVPWANVECAYQPARLDAEKGGEDY